MRLAIDIRPMKITGKSKQDILSRISRMGAYWTCGGRCGPATKGGGGIAYSAYRRDDTNRRSGDSDFILYNATKHRAKFRNDPAGGKKIKVREAHWDAWVYVVPARLVRQAKQHARNFTLVVG